MKYKFLTLSLLLAGACATMNAQSTKDNYYTQKWSDNIFISVGGGIHSVANDGFNRMSPHFSVSLGKYITPTWGIRGQVNGMWQSLCLQEIGYHEHNKKYVGANIDAMVNLSSLFAGANPNRFFEVYGFVGPQMTVAKNPEVTYTYDGATGDRTNISRGNYKTRAHFGASAGLGLKFNLSNKWAIDVEARGAIAPSIFGNISDHRKSEGSGMLTAGVSYTFGGKKFAKVEDRIVEKEVIREVIREVPKEVVREVVKEVPTAASEVAIFFKIGKAKISPEGMVNVQLIAKAIKANPNTKYKVAGFADKATGSASFNEALSEKRAQAVYDALVAEGVKESQLEKVAMGGTDNMFGKNYLNRVVILEAK